MVVLFCCAYKICLFDFKFGFLKVQLAKLDNNHFILSSITLMRFPANMDFSMNLESSNEWEVSIELLLQILGITTLQPNSNDDENNTNTQDLE